VSSLGRGTEFRTLCDLLTAAQNSSGGTVIVSGEAGIGKSHLLGALAEEARRRQFRVLVAQGHLGRSSLPFAVTVSLLDSLLPEAQSVPASGSGIEMQEGFGSDGNLTRHLRQRPPDILRLESGPVTNLEESESATESLDPLEDSGVLHRIRQGSDASDQPPPALSAVGTALLLRFCQAADQQPILLVIDDVQWADPSSVSVLSFVAKRLFADRIVMVFGQRINPSLEGDSTSPSLLTRSHRGGSEPSSTWAQGSGPSSAESSAAAEFRNFARLALEPLSADESVELLESLGCGHLDAVAASPRAGGLPLALTELARNLTDSALQSLNTGGHEASPQPLSLPAHYLRTIELLPAEARRTLAICALDDEYQLVFDVVGELVGEHLSLAKQANIIDRIGQHVEFRHPLLRAASLAWLDRASIAELHRNIASKLDARTQSDRIAQHLSAAALGPDPEIANTLHEFALRARARSAHREAASAWARSAELTLEPDLKAKRLIDCAKALHVARFPDDAMAAAERALAVTNTALIRASAVTLIGNISMWDRNPEETTLRVLSMANEVETSEPASSAWACIAAASLSLLCAKIERGVVLARRAEQLAKVGSDPIAELAASAITSWNLFLTGEIRESTERVEALTPIVEMLLDQQLGESIVLGQTFTMRLIMEERFSEADRLLLRLLPLAQRLGDDLSATLFSVVLSTLRWRQGRSDEALLYATEYLHAERLPSLAFAWAAASAAQIFAALGRVDRTRELANSALALAGSNGVSAPLIEAWALAAQAHIFVAQGDYKSALGLYRRVATEVKNASSASPNFSIGMVTTLKPCSQKASLQRPRRFSKSLSN
jgi:tetratricopeptide (TPR) repeat protein